MSDALRFDQPETAQAWQNYLQRSHDLAISLAPSQRRDMLSEIKVHLLESMREQSGTEHQQLIAAQRCLGQPEDFVPGWVEERLAESADASLLVYSRWQLLRLDARAGLLGLIRSMMFGFGFMVAFYAFAIVVLKLIFPENVGIFVLSNGIPLMGYADADGVREVVGWWLIPINLLVGSLILWWLNRRLRRLDRSR